MFGKEKELQIEEPLRYARPYQTDAQKLHAKLNERVRDIMLYIGHKKKKYWVEASMTPDEILRACTDFNNATGGFWQANLVRTFVFVDNDSAQNHLPQIKPPNVVDPKTFWDRLNMLQAGKVDVQHAYEAWDIVLSRLSNNLESHIRIDPAKIKDYQRIQSNNMKILIRHVREQYREFKNFIEGYEQELNNIKDYMREA